MTKRYLSKGWRPLVLGPLLLPILGCAVMRKDTAALPEIKAEWIRAAGAQGQGEWPGSRWWTRYRDEQLDVLIGRALKGAPAMLVARQRFRMSEAVARRVDASTGPYIGMVGSVDRQEVSGSSFYFPFYGDMMGSKFAGPYYTEGTLGLEGGYTFDLWGKDKAQIQAALGMLRAGQAEMAETELLLSTRIAQAYFQYQGAQATLAVLVQARRLLQERDEGYHAQLERGLVERSAMDLAQARLLEMEGQIQEMRQRGLIIREQIRCLLGAGADDFPELRAVPLPEVAGGSLPELGYELLARRPDLQAMRWYVQASLSQVEVAKASFYPSFDLKAFFGFDALHTGDLLKSQSRQRNLVPGFSLPIFDSGRLNANLAQTRARSNTTIASYNQAVVDAVRQVAECGIELEGLGRQLHLQCSELETHQSALASLQAKHACGLIDRIALAEGGLPVVSQQAKLIQLRQRQVLAEVNLTRALGGGYRADQMSGGNH